MSQVEERAVSSELVSQVSGRGGIDSGWVSTTHVPREAEASGRMGFISDSFQGVC